jgi:hypothetical protein
MDSALLVSDLGSWVSALLAVAVSRYGLGLGTFVHRLGRHVAWLAIFLLVIIRISGFWSMNALVSAGAFHNLHASFVCGRLRFGHARMLIAYE